MSTNSKSDLKKKTNPAVHFLAGGVGGTIGAVITCPLEVIKTRLQSSLYRNDANNGVIRMIRQIYLNEGVRGLWRGIGPNLIGVIPSRAIYFSSYASAKQYFTELNNGKESSAVHLVSAACAGVCVATVTNPIWLVKTRMQMQSEKVTLTSSKSSVTDALNIKQKVAAFSTSATINAMPHYKNSLDCFRQILKQEGVFGFTRGLGASYLGIMEGTLQWVIYEYLKKTVKEYRQSTSGTFSDKLQSYDYFFTAACSKFVSAVISYPHEVLRTRLRQVKTVTQNGNQATVAVYKGFGDVFKRVLKEEGILAFYGGMSAHLLRTVPNAAIMFLCYETVVSFLSDLEDK